MEEGETETDSLLRGCLEALIPPLTHTHTHTNHSNVKSNLLTRREKGQRQQACKDPFPAFFLPPVLQTPDISASNAGSGRKLLNLSRRLRLKAHAVTRHQQRCERNGGERKANDEGKANSESGR